MTQLLLALAVLIPSVILHEVAHGAVALRFGDPTARDAGRLTLNPVKHIDPFGTVILPALLALTGAGVFGYAKPVPVDPGRMRKPRDHGLLTSLAGPAVNIVLAVVAAMVLRGMLADPDRVGFGSEDLVLRSVLMFGVINVVLAAFNLLPLPPLDGSAVVERLLPARWLPRWHQLRQYSMGILLVVVLLLPGVLNRIFSAALSVWRLLL